ncbi:PQQ-binding-like beta-propeller repeat protein [Natronococcus sp.]|uniref:outer membrane protein assembly factor BamB family protein n=1 Tax=Natronococcus sp. TaxID=35747 RepID=UPI003A4E07D4
MGDWQRRSVLTTGVALSASGLLASVGAAETRSGSSDEKHGSWSSYGGNAGNTRYVSTADGFEKPDRIDWQYEKTGSIVADGDTVYLRTEGGIHAVDAATGTRRWVCEGIQARGTPTIGEDAVYVAGDQLTAIDADSGEVRWREHLGEDASTSEPVAAFDSVYLTVDGTLYAVAAADGSCRWTHETVTALRDSKIDPDGPASVSYTFSTRPGSVAAVAGSVWALLDGRRSEKPLDTDAVAAFEPHSAERLRTSRFEAGDFGEGLSATERTLFVDHSAEEGVLSTGREATERSRLTSDALTTAAVGETIVTRGRYALGSTSPESTWKKEGTHSYGPPAIVDDTVVAVRSHPGSSSPDEVVGSCLDDGTEEWTFTFDETQWNDGFNEECVVTENRVYVTRDNGLTALCPA